ncbi:MAG: VOC family protein [Chitinophagaceae bacterium]|nr:MAG: VOC family protein [Chitinophagaceae bacterium]
MAQVNFYFNFPGTAEAAIRFYQSVLGGDIPVIMRMKDAPPMPGYTLVEEEQEKIMHIGLQLPNGSMFMASDALESLGYKLEVGNNITVSLSPSSKEEADKFYSGLSEGGSKLSGMKLEFWGDYFGTFTDKFGIGWMISFNENPGQGELFDKLETGKKS